MSKKILQNQKGFTLLEVLISLGLLIVVFGGVTGLMIISSEASRGSKNNLIASYLAKEAQDTVRYKRDLNYLLAVPPFTDIADDTGDGNILYYTINYDGSVAATADPNVKNVSALVVSSNFYAQAVGTPLTNFRRLVTTTYHVAAGPLPAYIDVKVEVYWTQQR
jgi:prepilin-type N-terminal cleavage/methylation domain-containing protein